MNQCQGLKWLPLRPYAIIFEFGQGWLILREYVDLTLDKSTNLVHQFSVIIIMFSVFCAVCQFDRPLFCDWSTKIAPPSQPIE